jgi:hypothetical protein
MDFSTGFEVLVDEPANVGLPAADVELKSKLVNFLEGKSLFALASYVSQYYDAWTIL